MNEELKNKVKEHNKKVKDLNSEEQALYKELKAEFKREIKEWRTENPQYISASVYVNNHEFNDGDATRFYCGIADEWNVETEDSEDTIEPPKFVKNYDCINGFWEYMYGDEYGSIELFCNN